jgi:hypothetical protein
MIRVRSILDTLNPVVSEEQLIEEIAYYKARLADIRKAPATSRHRERLEHVADRLHQREMMLAQMRTHRPREYQYRC